MGNVRKCKCKCKEKKKEGELDLPNTKANINEIENAEFKHHKNLSNLFKKNPKIEKKIEDEDFNLSEIKINDLDNKYYNLKLKPENDKRTKENSFKRKKLEINDKINSDNSNAKSTSRNKSLKKIESENSFNKENKKPKFPFKKQKTLLEKSNNKNFFINQNPKKTFFLNRTKTFLGINKFNYKNDININSITERENSFITEFQNTNCKDFFEKYRLNCVQLMKKIPIKSIINNINLLYNDDQENTLFQSEINRLQISGERIIYKKYFNRFLVSTKKEIKIFASKEKFITLQNPIQIFYYNQMKRSSFIEFDNGKKDYNTFEFNNKKDFFHFLIYFNNESFEILSSLKQELIEKWVSLINYLIDIQDDISIDENFKDKSEESI